MEPPSDFLHTFVIYFIRISLKPSYGKIETPLNQARINIVTISGNLIELIFSRPI